MKTPGNGTTSSIQRQRPRKQESEPEEIDPALHPVRLLEKKQSHYEGDFNTMEVFNTLTSMYTKERWEELQAKRRGDLNFDHLYWVSRYDPRPNDGYHMDTLINAKVNASRDACME